RRKDCGDNVSRFVELEPGPARKRSTADDVLSRQGRGRNASVGMEAHRHIVAGAGNTIDVLIACQAEASQALLRVEQHHCSTAARQAIDLLISTQLHIVDTPVLLSAVVTDERAGAESARAELLLARQRDASQLARAAEPRLAPARDTRKIDILLEDDDARPA